MQQHTSDSGEVFEGTVAANGTVNIAELTEMPNAFVLTNTGTTPLTFCLQTSASNACVAGVALNPGESQVVQTSELGEDGNTFLNVTNASVDTAGAFEVEVV